MTKPPAAESALYAPVRDLLVAQGYEVKSEVRHCDVVAQRGDEPIVVVELKRQLNLDLLLQGIDRQSLTDSVYIAVPASARRKGRDGWRRWRRTLGLLRRLGLGLVTVADDTASVELEPAPYTPRRNTRAAARRRGRLMDEFMRRDGDPNVGGITRIKVVTAYRQEAMACAALLAEHGPMSLAELRDGTGRPDISRVLQKDLYGWFERVSRGVYRVTDAGRAGLAQFSASPGPTLNVTAEALNVAAEALNVAAEAAVPHPGKPRRKHRAAPR